MKKTLFATLLLLCGTVWNAHATLTAVGPAVEPAGYPWFYQDSENLQLQLCLDQNGFCLTGEPDPAQPLSFPDNFGDEVFWWSADALAPPLVTNGKAILVLGLEGAFAGTGALQDGQQISFARVRVRVDVAEAGSYRIIHPYGQIDFPNVTVADGINFTEDIGSINALNPALGFSGALAGKIGPFLTWPDYADPLVNPDLQVPVLDDQGLPTGEILQYVGDPNIPHVVVGSPTGNNVFRIQKLVGANYVTVSETEFFAITGKVLPANAVQPAAWLFPDAPAQNLFAVGPVNRAGEVGGITPQQPEGIRTGTLYTGYPIGFPAWYQERLQVEDPQNPGTFIDAGGEKLTICPAVDPMCISAPIDPADPASVALGVGEEAFWWSSEAFINDRTTDITDLPAGLDGILVLALEAAFGGVGSVNQRPVRFRPAAYPRRCAGTGRLHHHPSLRRGVFENVTVADGINMTRDVGIIDAADPDPAFVGALYSNIGPRFLAWPDYANRDPQFLIDNPEYVALQQVFNPNDAASPLVQYLGDPAVSHTVEGSVLADGGHPSGSRIISAFRGRTASTCRPVFSLLPARFSLRIPSRSFRIRTRPSPSTMSRPPKPGLR